MGAGYPFALDNWQDPADASKNTGKRLRQVLGLPWFGHRTNRTLGARSGLPNGMPAVVTVAGSAWTVIEHGGIIDAEVSATAGPVHYSFDTQQTGSVNAAHATLGRIDLISVQVSDPTQDASSTPGIAIVYTPGTAASTPAAPATPARSLALAQISVPSAASGNPAVVTMVAPFTCAVGGILQTRSATERPDGSSGAYVGQYIDDPTFGLMRWNGTLWLPVTLVIRSSDAGSGTINFSAGSDQSQTRTVPFGFTYSSPPDVLLGLVDNEGNYILMVQTVTTTGFTIYGQQVAGSTAALGHNIGWVAFVRGT